MESNKLNIMKLVILGIIAIVLTAILIIMLNGNMNFQGITIKGNNKLIYDKSFKEEISLIDIITKNNDVEISESEAEEINVKIYDLEDSEAEAYVENNRLVINNKNENKLIGVIGINNSPKIVLSIPKNKLYDLNVDGSSSDVNSKVNLGNINISTKSGDIKLKNANSAKINCTSGDVLLNKVQSLELKVTSGDIKIYEINDKANIQTTSGDISINKLNLNSNSQVQAKSGDITIGKTNDIYVDAKAKSGDIRVNSNNRQAKYELKLSTTSGDITVNN